MSNKQQASAIKIRTFLVRLGQQVWVLVEPGVAGECSLSRPSVHHKEISQAFTQARSKDMDPLIFHYPSA